jgi:uncharacterized protein YdeI (YjbR/CyaY-like superfamily)
MEASSEKFIRSEHLEISKTLYVTDRKKWRAWLRKNHAKQKEIWLIYYKKHTGKPRIPYDDAVEEALCFGWIDSTVKRIDDEKYAQRYTPRNEKSIWSELNVKRANRMVAENKMTEAGMRLFRLAEKSRVPDVIPMPAALATALKKNKKAWENFKKMAPSYKKLYIWYITSAKMESTKKKRIRKAVEHAAKNSRYPVG